jgi:plasmid stabilization system protein ParE
MSNYILSPLARQDLNDIWDYIAQDDFDAADRIINEIHDAILLMSSMPGIGHLREDLTDEPLRFWPVRRYLIVYHTGAEPLEIVRVLSAYRDVHGLLQ